MKKFKNTISKLKLPFSKKFLLSIGIVSIVGIIAFIMIFRHVKTVEAVWFDDNWLYRKAVPLTNSSGSEQTDFQVMISWDTTSLVSEGKIQSNCDDFRVTDINGNKLEYWLEPGTCNTATTKIWTKVSSIPTSGATVYVYYGNSSAISESSTTNTFIREIDNVQGAWNMDEASWNGTPSEVVDSSGNSNHGTAVGGATTTTGKFGNGGSFDASDNKATVADANSLDLSSGVTLSAWIKASEAQWNNSSQKIMSKWAYGSTADFQDTTNWDVYNSINEDGIGTNLYSPAGAIFDGRYVYFAPDWVSFFGKILRYDTTGSYSNTNYWDVYDVTNEDGVGRMVGFRGGVFDGRYVYFAPFQSHVSPYYYGKVLRYDTALSFSDSGSWDVYNAEAEDGYTMKGFSGAVFDGRYVYFVPRVNGTGSRFGKILRYDTTASFSDGGSWDVYNAEAEDGYTMKGFYGAAFDGRYVYFVPENDGTSLFGRVLRYDTTDSFSDGGSWDVYDAKNEDGANGMKGFTGAVFDGRYVYFVPYNNGAVFGKVLRYDTTLSFSSEGSWDVYNAENEDGANGMKGFLFGVFDGRYVYFVPYNNGATFGKFLRYDTTLSFSETASWDVYDAKNEDGDNLMKGFRGGVFDGRYIYFLPFGGTNNRGKILRYDTTNTKASYSLDYSASSNSFGAVPQTLTVRLPVSGGIRTVSYTGAGNSNLKDSFHHLAVSYDGTTVKMYLDGTLVKSQAYTTYAPLLSTTAGLALGSSTDGKEYFNGTIDDARVYSSALSQAEITDIYSSGGSNQGYTTANYPNKELVRKYSASVTVGTAASEEQSPSPAAYWKFDEGTGTMAQDSTDNNNDGTISGATWQTEDMCVSGKCLKFDGTNDVVTVSNTVAGIKTVSFWARAATTSEQYIDLNASAYIQSSSGTVSTTGFTDPTIYIDGEAGTTVSSNKWHYITVTTDTAISGSAIKLGQISTNYGQIFLDEFKIYPYARSAAEILTDYNSRGSVHGASVSVNGESAWISDGLVGYWKMDESSWSGVANEVIDASGNSNHGVAVSGATTASGKFGNGGTFDGTDDYVSISGAVLSSISTFTVSAWVNANNFTGSPVIFGQATNAGQPFWHLRLDSGGFLDFKYKNAASGDETNIVSTGTIATSEWHYLAVTYDSKVGFKLYRDGSLDSSSTEKMDGSYTTTKTAIGAFDRSTVSQYFSGLIDETRIYNRALSASEIRQLADFAPGPVAHWKMDEGSGTSAADTSGNGNTGTLTDGPTWNTGKYGKAVNMDGTNDYVNVADSASLDFGTGNFTLEAWVKSIEAVNQETDQLGDIVSKFDQTNKKGFNLGFLRQSSLGSQSNNRNLFFGIDNNHPDTAWVEKASMLGAETNVFSLAVYNGKLYAGTSPNGKLYEWNGTNAWVEKAPKLGAESIIYSLAVYNGKLYGGTSPNGKLYEWNGTDAWVEKAPKLGTEGRIYSLAVYNGKLYGGTYPNGKLYEWNGTDAWVEKAPMLGAEILIYSLAVYNSKLYGGTSQNGKLYEWNGTNAWVEKAPQLGAETRISSLAVYNGKLYGGTDQNGKLYEWNGTNAWVEKAPKLGAETRIWSLAVYNGKLYGGTYPNGKLYEWNGTNAWVEKAPMLGAETYIMSLAVYNGKLYGGTGQNGKLYGWKTGVSASYDYEVPAGWQHVTAVKDTTTLKLYLNGILVDTSDTFNSGDYDLSNSNNLLLGFGEQDYLKGNLDDVRVYNYARSPDQIKEDMLGDHPAVTAGGGERSAPIAWYRFNEGYSTTANNSGSAGSTLNGTLTNMSSPATATSGWTNSGKLGKGLVFDGGNDYVSLGNSSSFNIETSVTYSAWIYPTASQDGWILNKYAAGAEDKGFYMYSDRKVNFYLYNTFGGSVLQSNSTLSLNSWTHLVAVYDGSTAKLYVNGKLDNSKNASGDVADSTGIMYIGRNPDRSAAYWPFPGSIDEVKIYNYALTEDEVKLDYNQGAVLVLGATGTNSSYSSYSFNQTYCVPGDTTSCASPVAEWNFNEGTGTSANDTSGNANTGTLTSGPTWVSGKQGKGVRFDGSNDYIDAGNNTVLQNIFNNTATVEAWFYPKSLGESNLGLIITKRRWQIQVNANNSLLFQRSWTGSTPKWVTPNNSINLNNWNHVTVIYNDSSISNDPTVYINGILQTLTEVLAPNGSVASDSDDVVNLGNRNYGVGGGDLDEGFDGLIDQVRIFNYARSPAQIAWDYNRGAPVAHYKLDECQGSTLHSSNEVYNSSLNGTWYGTGGGTQTSVGDCSTSATTAWYSGRTGKYNASLNFDGTDDYVSVVDSNNLDISGNMTVSTWVKANSIPASGQIAIKWAAGNYWYLKVISSGTKFQFTPNTDSTLLQSTSNAVSTTAWQHVVVVYDGSYLKMYIDGVLNNSQAYSSGITTNDGSLVIGSLSGTQSFPGLIDDVRIYNYALTETQIKEIYNNGAVYFGPSNGMP